MLRSVRLSPQFAHSFSDTVVAHDEFEHAVSGSAFATQLFVSPGDPVNLGDALLEVEGEKHKAVLPAPCRGVIVNTPVLRDIRIGQNEVVLAIDDQIDRRLLSRRSFYEMGFSLDEPYLELLGAIELNRHLDEEPTTHLLCNHATILFELGTGSDVVDELIQRSLDLDDSNAAAYAIRARAVSGDFDRKCRLLEQAIDCAPDDIALQHMLAMAHSDVGRFEEAIGILQRHLQDFGETYRTFSLLAIVSRRAGRTDDCAKYFTLADKSLETLMKWKDRE